MSSPQQYSRPRPLMTVVFAAVGFVLVAVSVCWALDITIEVAPSVLNLQNNGQVVTVHTDLLYSKVASASVEIDGLPISWWKMDNRGYFVAKFEIEAVKGLDLKVGEYNTLTLTGQTTTGETFAGSAEVLVIDKGSDAVPPTNQYRLTVSSTAGGVVTSPGEGTFLYDGGTEVLLQATADPLFKFVGWRGSLSTDRNPCPVTMDGDFTVTAHFESSLDSLYVDADANDPKEGGAAEHPFDSIQEALEVAKSGARIVIRPGTYFETIDLLGKSVQLTGLDDDDPNHIAALPVIHGGDKDVAVRCTSGEDPNCLLRGLVVTGGNGPTGGGILCIGSSPTIQNCLIVGNRTTAIGAGGGIHCQDSNAVFINCTVCGNYGGSEGAGVYFSQSDATMVDSIVWENAPAQIVVVGSGRPVVAYTDVMRGWPGERILSDDPHFAQSGYWAHPADPARVLPPTDPTAVCVSGDYHLMSQVGRWDPISKTWIQDPITSLCIDAGDPNAPVGQEPLPHGGRINLGVYGGTNQASMSPTGG